MGFYDLGIFIPFYFVLLVLNGLAIHHKSSNEIERFYGISSFPSPKALVNDSQPYRTEFHFQPPRNWMNDPNGPMIYKGVYHLFYQYNPKAAVWGNIVWGHSTSTDLINWTPQPEAIWPSIPSDINGCFSGSATLLSDGKPAILYTGSFNSDNQVQNLALPKDPSDPYLKEWVKVPQNPIMTATPINKINSSQFRDPTTAWLLSSDGDWRVAVGAEIEGRGMALLYKSSDFIDWTEAEQPLHSIEGSGMWECPDFYPVYLERQVGADTSALNDSNDNLTKVVLKASMAERSYDAYLIGSYDVQRDIFVPDKGDDQFRLRYDYGKFYASKSFYDSVKKRRVLWGWVDEMSSKSDNIQKGWAGLQSFPRTILSDESGDQLLQWPVEEIESLREKQVDFGGSRITGGSLIEVSGVTAAQADVEISFKIEDFNKSENFDPSWTNPQVLCSERGESVRGGIGPFGLMVLASENWAEYTAVFFRVFRSLGNNSSIVLMCSDQSRSSLSSSNDRTSYGTFVKLDPRVEELSLRILIDHSIVESFGAGGRNCITARVYPTLAVNDKAHLYAFNNGTESVQITELSAWSMKKARVN